MGGGDTLLTMMPAQQTLRWLSCLVFAVGFAAAPCAADPGPGAVAQRPAVVEPFVIGERGVGRFVGHKYVDDVVTLASLRAVIADVADMSVEFAVKDIGDEVETEEGYFSVRIADREVLQLMRPAEQGQLLSAEVVDPVFVTTAGIRVGDKVKKLAAAYPGLTCVARKSMPPTIAANRRIAVLQFRSELSLVEKYLSSSAPGSLLPKAGQTGIMRCFY
jgi:hypothetical protein